MLSNNIYIRRSYAAAIALALLVTLGLALWLLFKGNLPAMALSDRERKAIAEETAAAADAGRAALKLGQRYEKGQGVPRDLTKALGWYKQAADEGLAAGFYNVGACYEIGLGVTTDYKKALASYEKASRLGLAQAHYKLAEIYSRGKLAKADPREVARYLDKAQAAGHATAANELGVMAFKAKDIQKAVAMFRRGAQLGNGEAMKNLGVICKDGLAGAKDLTQALGWYLLAKKAGYQSGDMDAIIDGLRKGLKPEEIQRAEAMASNPGTKG